MISNVALSLPLLQSLWDKEDNSGEVLMKISCKQRLAPVSEADWLHSSALPQGDEGSPLGFRTLHLYAHCSTRLLYDLSLRD